MNKKLHSSPYAGTNNRKKTLARIKADARVQSIPIFYKDKRGIPTKILGYRYIYH